MRLARFLFRLALSFLPRDLRHRRGPEMLALFEVNYRTARRCGTLRAVAATASATCDVLSFAFSHRRAALRSQTPNDSSRSSDTMVLDVIRQDIAQAIRSLRKTPRYTLMSSVTLALGIGANASIFSVVNGVMLRPLPFREPHRVVHVGWQYDAVFSSWMTAWQYEFWRDHTDAFSAVATYREFDETLGADENGSSVSGLRVSHQFLDVIGVPPVLGRGFQPDDDVPGAPDVVVIGTRIWRDQFAGSPDVIGRRLLLGDMPRTVIGVLPPEFDFPQTPDHTDVLLPLRLRADPQDEGENYQFLARMRDGVTPATADAHVRSVTNAFRDAHPDLVLGNTMRLSSYQEIFVGGLRSTLTILMAAIGFVLLIACANVTHLNLARATERARELAVRTALGATPGRIASQVLWESIVLSGLGAVAGVALAPWATNAVLTMSPAELPGLERVTLDWTIVGFAFAAALTAGLAVGAASVWSSTRQQVTSALRDGDRSSTGRGRTRQTLLAVEAALSMVLLVGAGLLISTLREIYRVDPGFERDGLYTVRFEKALRGYNDAGALAELERRVIEQLRNHPAVTAVAGASSLPLERGINIPVTIAGRPDDHEGAVEWRAVSAGYTVTLRVAMIRGRAFSTADNVIGANRVVIINESFATRYFPDQDPLGQRIHIGRYRDRYIYPELEVPAAEIIGVVADVRDMSLKNDPRRTILVPYATTPAILARPPVFLIRARESGDVVRAIRAALVDVDPELPTPLIRPMDEVIAASVARERFNAALMTAFAGLALLLTIVGIYGVVAYDVRKRAREIGIRMALGAGARSVVGLTVRRGVTPVLIGLTTGTVAALFLSRLISSMLWGVSPTDPATVVAVALILTGSAALASYIPARAAAAGDPRVALE